MVKITVKDLVEKISKCNSSSTLCYLLFFSYSILNSYTHIPLRFFYDPATTMKIQLRSVYANGDSATRLLRHRRPGYAFVALLCHFYIKSEV